jgi:hypothetical protein
MSCVIGLIRKLSKVRGRGGRSNISSKAFGDSLAVRPKAKINISLEKHEIVKIYMNRNPSKELFMF